MVNCFSYSYHFYCQFSGGIPQFGGTNAQDVAMASLINYVYDKDNFQVSCPMERNFFSLRAV